MPEAWKGAWQGSGRASAACMQGHTAAASPAAGRRRGSAAHSSHATTPPAAVLWPPEPPKRSLRWISRAPMPTTVQWAHPIQAGASVRPGGRTSLAVQASGPRAAPSAMASSRLAPAAYVLVMALCSGGWRRGGSLQPWLPDTLPPPKGAPAAAAAAASPAHAGTSQRCCAAKEQPIWSTALPSSPSGSSQNPTTD